MDTLEYNGEIYMRRNAKWVDSRNLVVFDSLQKILNPLHLEKFDYSRYTLTSWWQRVISLKKARHI